MRIVVTAFFLLIVFAAAPFAGTLSPQLLPCGKPGEAGGLGAGTDLTRFKVDTALYPTAICNDGSPAVFYVAPFSRDEDRNKWVIFLQGGGGCREGQSCAERWCSSGTNFGMDKMTSSLSKPSIRGNGIMSPEARNRFSGWNRVLLYFCSSDHWAGTQTVTLRASAPGSPGSAEVSYDIHFRGSFIVDAVLATLRRDACRRRLVRRPPSGPGPEVLPSALPDLDEATEVLLAGSSAGGGGVRLNMDRVGDLLRAANVRCQAGQPCPLIYRAAMDASYAVRYDRLDISKSPFCRNDPDLCTYESFFRNEFEVTKTQTWGVKTDASCLEWHSTREPDTTWKCADETHLLGNHLTTPFFVRMDHQDQLIAGNFVENGFGTYEEFGRLENQQLNELAQYDLLAEEGSVRSGGPALQTPGVFGPQCTHHESMTNNPPYFDVKISGSSFHDTLWNWWNGAQPQNLVRPFTQTGRAPECP